jgi:hypothetical protein
LPQERLRGKIPNKERYETYLNEEPINPRNSKMQYKMHTKSIFVELGFVEEIEKISRTSHK